MSSRLKRRSRGYGGDSETPAWHQARHQGPTYPGGMGEKDENELGAWLLAQRQKTGLSLRKAAKRAGITHSRLGDLEKGVSHVTLRPTRPRRELAERIAKIYNAPMDQLAEVGGWGRLPEFTDPDLSSLLAAFKPLSNPNRRLVLAIVLAALAVQNDVDLEEVRA